MRSSKARIVRKLCMPLRESKGMAMVLALSLTGLLSLLGLWAVMQSKTAFRVTSATTRYERVFKCAIHGCW